MTTANKTLHVVSEGANYATDPTTGYLAVPADSIGELTAVRTPLQTAYATGRGLPTANIAGPMAWSFDFVIPIEGLSASAAAAASPPADDYADVIWAHIAGNSESLDGETVVSSASSTAVVLGSDDRNIQQLVPFYEAGVPAVTRTQWQLVTVDPADGSYTLAPGFADFGSNPPTSAAIAYGCNAYFQTAAGQGGNSLMFVYNDDGTEYSLLGGRITSASIEGNVGERALMSISVAGDRWATSSIAPTATAGPAITPAVMTISPVHFNGTAVATRKVSIDLNISATENKSTAGLHGRAGYDNQAVMPSTEISTLRDDNTWKAVQAAQTPGRLLVQFGGGVLSGGALGTCALHVEVVQVEVQNPEDDEGRSRQSLTLPAKDGGFFTGTTVARSWQFARA